MNSRSSPARPAGCLPLDCWSVIPAFAASRMKTPSPRTWRHSARPSSPPTPRHWTRSARRSSATATPTAGSRTRRPSSPTPPTERSKYLSLAYQDPSIRVVGPAAIVRFTFVGEPGVQRRQEDAAEPAHPDELAEAGFGLEAAVARRDQALIRI